MKYAVAGKSYVQHFDFEVDGQLVVPTAASYSVRNNAQEIVEGLEDETIDLTSSPTSINIMLAEEVQTVDAPNTLRYVDLQFTYGDIVYQVGDFYGVRESMILPIKPDQVRFVLGVSDAELPDEAIDLYQAYFLVQGEVGLTLDDIITSGSEQLPYLVEAVICKAAMSFYTSMQTSIMQSEQADNSLYKRFAKVDFGALKAELAGRYAIALRQLTGDVAVTPLLSTLAQGTDAVTGE